MSSEVNGQAQMPTHIPTKVPEQNITNTKARAWEERKALMDNTIQQYDPTFP